MDEGAFEVIEYTVEECQTQIDEWKKRLAEYENPDPTKGLIKTLLRFAPQMIEQKIQKSRRAIVEWERRLDIANREGKFRYEMSREEWMNEFQSGVGRISTLEKPK